MVLPFAPTNWKGTLELIGGYLGVRGAKGAGTGITAPPATSLFGDIQSFVGGHASGVVPTLATVVVILLSLVGVLSTIPRRRFVRGRHPPSKASLPRSNETGKPAGGLGEGWAIFVLLWFATLLAMVWPGKGYLRFYAQWIPFLPVAMCMGYSTLERMGLKKILLVLSFLLVLNVTVAVPPPEMYRESKSELEAILWLSRNHPEDRWSAHAQS